jgi:transcription factor SFP1
MPWVNDWFVRSSKAASTSQAEGSPSGAASHSAYEDQVEVAFIDDNSNTSSPFSNQPPTPDDNDIDHASVTMPMTSPIDIATPTRNASSSPSSQGKKPVYHDIDSRSSAMMSGTAFDSSMGRGRQDSFGGAKPISMNNPNRNNDGRPRRESLAGSLVQGMSWGGVSVGSWIRDE